MYSINMPTMGYYRGAEEKKSTIDRCASVLMIPERKKLQKNVYLKEIIIIRIFALSVQIFTLLYVA